MINETNYPEYSIVGNYYTKKISRMNGYCKLSDKTQLLNHLKKSKFCQIKLKYGKCNRQSCNFAHSNEELSKPICAFGKDCNKQETCGFLHID
jgi:hypothetical protein